MSQTQPSPRKFPRVQRTGHILGLGSTGPRVRTPSQSPAPPSLRSPSPAISSSQVRQTAPSQTKEQPKCKACGGSSFEDAGNGQTVCIDCGVVSHDSGNYASEVAFSDDATGRTTQQGVRIGLNQTHQTNYNQNRGGQFGYINQGGGISSADRAKSEANSYFGTLQGPLGIQQLEIHRALNIFTYAYASGFVRGRTIESVATVSLYLATRAAKKRLLEAKQSPYSLMLIDFAEKAGMNVFDLGRMMQDMVKKLYLNVGDDDKMREASLLLQAPGAEALVDKFVDNLDFPQDIAPRIKDDATKILQRMKRDWIHHGRRPSGVCGAAVILAARMNNYRRTLREVVLCAKVTEFTVSKRLEEFQETASSKLSVSDFRIDDVRDALDEMDPPAYYMANKPKKAKKRGRKKKGAAPETAAEIEDTGSEIDVENNEDEDDDNNDEEGDETEHASDEPPAKRARIDADGFAVPDIPTARKGRGKPKGTKNWVAPPPTEAEIAYEAAMQSEIQEALDSNQDLDVAQPGDEPEELTREPTLEDVQVLPHAIPPRLDPPGPPARSNEGNSGNVSLDPVIGDTEFDDDPEVSTCLLNEAERVLKERIWVTENAEWLRQDHAKRIRRELKDQHLREQGIDPDELRRQKGKPKRKDGARRSGRTGDVSYLNDEYHKKKGDQTQSGTDTANDPDTAAEGTDSRSVGRRASDAVRKMMNQRGVYSRRINYENLMKTYQLPGEEDSPFSASRSPSRDRDAREDSVISVTSSVGGGNHGIGEWFKGNTYSNTRSKASIAAEKREATKKAARERSADSKSQSPSAAATEGSPTPDVEEILDDRQRSESTSSVPPTAASLNPPPPNIPTPPPTQSQPLYVQQQQQRQSKPSSPPPQPPQPTPQSPTNQPSPTSISSIDSPLSSTHTPLNTGSAIGTPTIAATIPARQPPRLPQNINEEDIESDEDDYVEDEDEDEDEGVDGVDAALAGQYHGHEWDDELVEDD